MIHVPTRENGTDPKTGQFMRLWLAFFERVGELASEWRAVDFDAANYTANGSMTWTVQTADQVTFNYCRMGNRLDLAFVIRLATVAGVVNTTLQIAIPGKNANREPLVAARDMTAPVLIVDNGTRAIGIATVVAGESVIKIQKADGSNWAAAANTNGVEGVIALEVK